MTQPNPDVTKRLAKLRELINDYRYHYHVLDESIMSEEAADSLKHELEQIESQYPQLITPDSPSQRVAGEALKGFTKVNHRFPMMSLADVFDEDEVRAWVKRIDKLVQGEDEFFCDVKMDGLASPVLQRNIDDQIVGDEHASTELRIDIRCDTI
jgi:DNA ligase (NAD+)